MPGEPAQQLDILEPDSQAGLAGTPVTQAELIGNFHYRPDLASYQNLQQQFEALRLQRDAIDAIPSHQEISGKGIAYADFSTLQW